MFERRSVLVALALFACKKDEALPQSHHVASYTIGLETVDAPKTVEPGAAFDVTASIENTGDTAWGTATTWLAYVGDKADGGVDLPLAAETAPGSTGTFSGSMTAPSSAGRVDLVWQPIIEGHELGTPITVEIAIEAGDTGTPPDDSGTDSGKDSGK